jgi:predicted HTH transcriptional regulator
VDQLITRGLVAKRESKYVEFKHSFDTGSTADWCEIIKDIVAMCNSGGGVILFGLDNKGNLTGFDPTPILNFDPAVLTDKVSKYTGVQFSEFEIVEGTKGRRTVAILRVYPRRNPIIFNKPGTY